MPTFTATDGRGSATSATPRVFVTGPAPGLILTVVNGDLTINDAWIAANGSTLDRYWIKGHLIFTASVPFHVTRSIISGRAFPTPGSPPRTAIVYARSAATPATALINLTDCEVYPVQPDVNIVCLSGEKIGKLTRVNLHGGSDLVNYWGSRVQVEDCWLHGFSFWANDPKHVDDASWPGASHNDGIQSNGCANGYVRRTLINMRADPAIGDYATLAARFPGGVWGSAVMLSGSNGFFTNFEVSECWLGHGQAPIAMPRQSGGVFENGGCSWDVHHNVFWALPDPYGTSDHQLVRWGAQKGPGPASVHDNTFVDHQVLRQGLRGTTLASAVLVGSGTAAQYIVRSSG
jgi:hypothetical protein